MDGRIFHLKAQIAHNLNHDWNVAKMAALLDLSVPHFQRLFKANVGLSPMAYVNNVRLEKARELLETTFHQVKQVGNETGLVNDSHLTRDFKRKFGLAPNAYRRHYWEKLQANNSDGRE